MSRKPPMVAATSTFRYGTSMAFAKVDRGAGDASRKGMCLSCREDCRRKLPNMPGVQLSVCPFCASDDVRFYEHVYAGQFAATCHACGAEGPRRQTCQEAGRLWNRRVQSQSRQGRGERQ